MLSDTTKTFAFTGHRPDKLGGYDESNAVAARTKAMLRAMITTAAERGYLTAISGMAIGTDMWAGEIVTAYFPELELIGAVPFNGQESKWPRESQVRYSALLDRCTSVFVVEEKASNRAFHLRNQFMVDCSSLLIAVWDGAPDGGTAACVKYARKQGRRIFWYNPKTDQAEILEPS